MNMFFDLDGTLLDSRKRIYQLFSDITGQEKLTFDQYWVHKRCMHSNEWLLEQYLNYSEEQLSEFRNKWFLNIESEQYLNIDVLFGPVLDLMHNLVKKKYDLFIVTARQFEASTYQQVERLGLTSYVKHTFVTGGQKSKHELLNGLPITSGDLYFGDTGLDIQTAKQIGIKSVAVLTGFRNKEVLLTYNPDVITSSVWEYFDDFPV